MEDTPCEDVCPSDTEGTSVSNGQCIRVPPAIVTQTCSFVFDEGEDILGQEDGRLGVPPSPGRLKTPGNRVLERATSVYSDTSSLNSVSMAQSDEQSSNTLESPVPSDIDQPCATEGTMDGAIGGHPALAREGSMHHQGTTEMAAQIHRKQKSPTLGVSMRTLLILSLLLQQVLCIVLMWVVWSMYLSDASGMLGKDMLLNVGITVELALEFELYQVALFLQGTAQTVMLGVQDQPEQLLDTFTALMTPMQDRKSVVWGLAAVLADSTAVEVTQRESDSMDPAGVPSLVTTMHAANTGWCDTNIIYLDFSTVWRVPTQRRECRATVDKFVAEVNAVKLPTDGFAIMSEDMVNGNVLLKSPILTIDNASYSQQGMVIAEIRNLQNMLTTFNPYDDSVVSIVSYASCKRNSTQVSEYGLSVASTWNGTGGRWNESLTWDYELQICALLEKDPTHFDFSYATATGAVWYYVSGVDMNNLTDAIKNMTWVVVVAIPAADFKVSSVFTQLTSGGLALVIIVLSAGTTFMLCAYITRPVRTMTDYLMQLATGKITPQEVSNQAALFTDFNVWSEVGAAITAKFQRLKGAIESGQVDLEKLQTEHQSLLHLLETTPIPTNKRTLLLCVGTWNVGNAPPPNDLSPWITPGHDIYAIGLQECVYGANSEEHFLGLLDTTLGPNYHRVAAANIVTGGREDDDRLRSPLVSGRLAGDDDVVSVAVKEGADLKDPTGSGGLRLAVYVHVAHRAHVEILGVHKEATGIAGAFWNKGGVGVGLRVYDTSVALVTSHLAAHQQKIKDRNKDFHRILGKLRLGQHNLPLGDYFDAVFWFGDLNYRIDLEHTEVLRLLSMDPPDFASLREHDQLTTERTQGRVFRGFDEPPSNFPPTYKYDRGSSQYETKQLRIPSWTDRILYRTNGLGVEVQEYTCTDDVTTSDHHPVRGTYKLHLPLFSVSVSRAHPCELHLTALMLSCCAPTPHSKPLLLTKAVMRLHCEPLPHLPRIFASTSWLHAVSSPSKDIFHFADQTIALQITDPQTLADARFAISIRDSDDVGRSSKTYSCLVPMHTAMGGDEPRTVTMQVGRGARCWGLLTMQIRLRWLPQPT